MKIALVCDWLTEIGGAENVLLTVHEMFPDAPIYTSQYRAKKTPQFDGCDVRTGWLNIFPRTFRKYISPLRALYFSHLNLSDYDLVISIANAEAKGIKTRGKHHSALHICYLQGPPTGYYWGMYDAYIKNPGFGKLNWLARLGLKLLVKPMRKSDYKAAQKPDHFVAISDYVARDIKKYYGRKTDIVFPPVDGLKATAQKRGGFVVAGRQAPWKRVDLAVQACLKTGDDLLVIGDGPDHKKLVELARGHDNISFLPRYNGPAEIVNHLASAKGFLFTSVEPFGITPIEAMSVGTPVIALRAGGALNFIDEGKNGLFFDKQNVNSLVSAIEKFHKTSFDANIIKKSATKFSVAKFKSNLRNLINEKVARNSTVA